MSSLPTEISNGVNNVRNTFSSWDSCMSKAYCKWPVIAGIIIGSIILLSVIWCIGSCLCCGATLCGSCVRCLTCFNCCGACGKSGGGGGRSRHKDDYTQMPPTPYNGYHSQPAPMTYQPPSSAPQYAQFDASSRKIHDDSLPAMPSWETARTMRVEDHSVPANGYADDVEMGRMASAPSPQPRTRGGYDRVPNGPVSPMSPPTHYGHFEGQAQPYSSDIGAQRLGQEPTGYSDFHPSPLSPAPTYRTNPTLPVVGVTDRFASGAMSPTPSEYHNRNFQPTREQAWSPLPHAQHETTDYQSYRRSLSPPVDQQYQHLNHQQQDLSAARPPSLLQIGRKPVVGSQREI